MQQQKTRHSWGRIQKGHGGSGGSGGCCNQATTTTKPRQTNKHFNKFKKYQARQWELQGKQAKGVPKESVARKNLRVRGSKLHCTLCTVVQLWSGLKACATPKRQLLLALFPTENLMSFALNSNARHNCKIKVQKQHFVGESQGWIKQESEQSQGGIQAEGKRSFSFAYLVRFCLGL